MLERIISDPTALALLLGLLPPLGGLLVAWTMSLLSRRGSLTPEQLEVVRGIVQLAVEAAEEWAGRKLQETGQKPHGLEKSALAMKRAKEAAPRPLRRKMSDDAWAVAVEAGVYEARRRGSIPSSLPPLK